MGMSVLLLNFNIESPTEETKLVLIGSRSHFSRDHAAAPPQFSLSLEPQAETIS
jgi:hypothetical protein